MRNAPATTILELAGHMDLQTTQKCMHLQSGAKEDAIRLLENRGHTNGKLTRNRSESVAGGSSRGDLGAANHKRLIDTILFGKMVEAA